MLKTACRLALLHVASACLSVTTVAWAGDFLEDYPLPPTANAGGPYSVLEENVADGVWAVTLNGSLSEAGDAESALESWTWAVPNVVLETFSGGGTADSWFMEGAEIDGDITLAGQSSWGTRYAFTKERYTRGWRTPAQARVTPLGGRAMWGFKRHDDGDPKYAYNWLSYGFYFNNGEIRIYEDGIDRGARLTYTPGWAYDLRIELKSGFGARYYMKRAESSEWLLVYDSAVGAMSGLLVGITVYDGTFVMDDVRYMRSGAVGEIVDIMIDGEYQVELRVMDTEGRDGTDEADITIIGEPPLASFDGPYTVLYGAELEFDGGESHDDVGIVSYQWDFGDGSSDSGPAVSHSYDHMQLYQAQLTVHDAAGRSDTHSVEVDVVPGVVCAPQGYDTLTDDEYPHLTWSDHAALLKAVVFTDTPIGNLMYSWDFGDGSASIGGFVADKRAVEALHVYDAAPGALFTATITIIDPVHGEYSDTYPLVVVPRDLYTEIVVGIDDGLWYLHKTQQPDGLWAGEGQASGFYDGSTASAIQAFAINGHSPTRRTRLDPYSQTLRTALDAMFDRLEATAIDGQPAGSADTNNNGLGVGNMSSRVVYETGQIMDAVAAIGERDRVVKVGSAGVIGRTHYDLLQDMVDMYAWGQTDTGSRRGGWRYVWNDTSSDNSASQWAAIGFMGARTAFDLDAPSFVKYENLDWLAFSQDEEEGYFGYQDLDCSYSCLATTPGGMIQLTYDGVPSSDERWELAEKWMSDHWVEFRDSRYVYAWYSLVKALRLAEPTPVEVLSGGVDWYHDPVEGLPRHILDWKTDADYTDGGWPDSSERPLGRAYTTSWVVIILSNTLFTLGPVAQAGDDVIWACDLPLTFAACGSYHRDPAREIVLYEWDFDEDGTYDYSSATECETQHIYGDCPPVGESTTFSARLRVTDAQGQTAVDGRGVTIAPPPHAPLAHAGGPYVAYRYIPFTPDSSASFDIDPMDYLTRVEWDFDGSNGYDFEHPDAAVDCVAGECPPVAWMFSELGEYAIAVRVWDAGVLNPVGCVLGIDCTPLPSLPDFTTVIVVDGAPPAVVASEPSGLSLVPVDQIQVEFSEPISAATFGVEDVSLVGPQGLVALDPPVTGDGVHWTIDFAAQSDGEYMFTIGPAVEDLSGGEMVAAYTGDFTIDATPPLVSAQTPLGFVTAPITNVDIEFSEALSPGTFTADDVSLDGPSGAVTINAPVEIGENVWRVSLDPQSRVGQYQLLLGPDVQDVAGHSMDAAWLGEFTILPLGDINCDGLVDLDDIDPFVVAIGGQAAYETRYPDCDWTRADCNGDGVVDFDDIDVFVGLLGFGS